LSPRQRKDIITGTYDATEYSLHNANYVIPNNRRTIYRDNRGRDYDYPDDPNGLIPLPVYNYGIYNSGTINTGKGDDTITGSNITESGYLILTNLDSIGIIRDSVGIYNRGMIYTEDGADSLISNGKLINSGTVNLGNGNNTITSYGKLINYDKVFLGDDDDTITSYGAIYNDGEIDTGKGNDFIIAYGGFESGLNNSERVLLGFDEDTLYGFGNGTFYGGSKEDRLQLTFGSYTVGRVGAAVSFTKGSSVMITYEFEKLITGYDTYDFDSLTPGQIINA
jgi:hypothetical protein